MTIKLVRDQDCPSPLEDNIKFVVLHRRYSNPSPDVGSSPDEVSAWTIANSDEWWISPLYVYDHSGTTYATRPFSCPWDSGRVGIIALKKTEWGPNLADQICENYTAWANGDCWGWVNSTPSASTARKRP